MSDDLDDVDDGAEAGASSDMSTAVLVITFLSLCIAIWVIGSVGVERYGLEYMGIAALAPRVGGESGKVLAVVTPAEDAAGAADPNKPVDAAAFPAYLRGSSYLMVNLGEEQGMRVGDRLQVSAQYLDGNAEYQVDVFIVGPNFCHAVCSTKIRKLDEGTFSGWGVKRIASGIEEKVVNRIFPKSP
jgi:hypothetical protein